MVPSYYKLAEQPFGATPDPRFLFHTLTHREALASLHYGVSARRGFTALIARPGMGKTTLLFDFLNKIKTQAKTAFLFQSQHTPQDLLQNLLADLDIEDQGADIARMQRKLIDFLNSEQREGRQLVVVLDEAQNLDESVLELLRMLSNFETPREKLMHLVLVGQPQLAEKLTSPRLTQLRQRISTIAQLRPLGAEETRLYIDHRLRVAGYDFAVPLFTKDALAAIVRHTEGIPRNINNLCFNAMSLGCALGKRTIDQHIIAEAIEDQDLTKFYVREHENPPFLRSLSKPADGKSWLPRIVIPLALLALLGLPLGERNRRVTQPPATPVEPVTSTVRANAKASPAAQATAPLPATPAVAIAQSVDNTRTVEVLPDDTLRQIIIQNLGKYDDETLAKIRELNPALRDPNYIRSGQIIRIPGTANSERQFAPIPKPANSSAGTETEIP